MLPVGLIVSGDESNATNVLLYLFAYDSAVDPEYPYIVAVELIVEEES